MGLLKLNDHKLTLHGNVSEVRKTKKGSTFVVSSTRKWTRKSDKITMEETILFACTAWGEFGELCIKSMYLGDLVYIEGRLMRLPVDSGAHPADYNVRITHFLVL